MEDKNIPPKNPPPIHPQPNIYPGSMYPTPIYPPQMNPLQMHPPQVFDPPTARVVVGTGLAPRPLPLIQPYPPPIPLPQPQLQPQPPPAPLPQAKPPPAAAPVDIQKKVASHVQTTSTTSTPASAVKQKTNMAKASDMISSDVLTALNADYDKPFEHIWDACDRLFPYHVLYEEELFKSSQETQKVGATASTATKEEGNDVDLELAHWARWREYVKTKVDQISDRSQNLEQSIGQLDRKTNHEYLEKYRLELALYRYALGTSVSEEDL